VSTHRLIGYAIVSADDRIADADGRFPEALRNDADWAHFQAGLDAAALTLLGRRSHEASPNVKGRRRLVMSRSSAGLEERADGWWWNPEVVTLGEALGSLLPDGGSVAVPGGRDVFDLVGAAGFSAFHLARATRVTLPGGRGLFAACESGTPAETVLAAGGLRAGPTRVLDEAAGVTLTVWQRA
jgi:hypothetical protein